MDIIFIIGKMKAKLVKENLGNVLKPKSKEDIIKELSNLSQEEKNEKLLDASDEGILNIVKLLIKLGADINAKNYDGNTPLIFASANGYLDIVKLLIENGADINVKNKRKHTALYWASIKGYEDIVELLKKYGAKE